jgi:hypothetical protein
MGASTFWNHQGLSRPVMGLLYLLPMSLKMTNFEISCTVQFEIHIAAYNLVTCHTINPCINLVCTGFWWGNLRERDRWGDPGVDGRIMLGLTFKKWDVGVRTGLGWLRIGTAGGRF